MSPAPKGNKFALGITTNGTPPIFSSESDIEDKINSYFESLLNEDQTQYETRPTVTGLALFMGFSSRQSLYDYGKKEDYSYIIKRAKVVIEMSYEEMLLTKASTGAIFALKNMGWIDKQKIEHSGEVSQTNKPVDLSSLSISELKAYRDIQSKIEDK